MHSKLLYTPTKQEMANSIQAQPTTNRWTSEAVHAYIFEPGCDAILMVAMLTRELQNFGVLLHGVMAHRARLPTGTSGRLVADCVADYV